MDLGIAVQKACENVTQPLKFLYPLDISIKEKIEAIAKSYGASGVEYSDQVTLYFSSLFFFANLFVFDIPEYDCKVLLSYQFRTVQLK